MAVLSEHFEDWGSLAKAQPNTWLTSNSNLYLADAILSDSDEDSERASLTFGGTIPRPPPDAFVRLPLNAYSIFDLSKSILLADKIAVLPGIGGLGPSIIYSRFLQIL